MKFLAWFFAVIVFFSSFFVIFTYNLHQTFLTPEKTKAALIKVDFYSQIKSVLRKDLFENGETDSAQISNASKAINSSLEQFNFQPIVENLISDFYQSIGRGINSSISIDLVEFKNVFISNLTASSDQQSADGISDSIPNSWKLDLAKYSGSLAAVAFTYSNYQLILIVYGVLVLLFFIFCILVNIKYLKLFFWVFMIVGIFTLIQLVLWKVINLTSLLAGIESQGRSGISTLIENFIDYFKQENISLLFWESIYIIGGSVLGFIIVAIIPTKLGNVPLHENK